MLYSLQCYRNNYLISLQIVDGENRTKLIVNYLPQTLKDMELWEIFARCGMVKIDDLENLTGLELKLRLAVNSSGIRNFPDLVSPKLTS